MKRKNWKNVMVNFEKQFCSFFYVVLFLLLLCILLFSDHKASCKELKTAKKMTTKYEEVFSMLTWESKRSDTERINALIESCLLLYQLAKNAKFFVGLDKYGWDDLGEDTEVLFVGKILYLHFFQCSVNDILVRSFSFFILSYWDWK